MAEELSAADIAIEAATSGIAPRALRVEELIIEADKNISRSGSFSSLSGDTSGKRLRKPVMRLLVPDPVVLLLWGLVKERAFKLGRCQDVMMIALGTYLPNFGTW